MRCCSDVMKPIEASSCCPPQGSAADAGRRESESDRASSQPDVGLQNPTLNLLLAMPHSHRRTRDV
jgi:hypothetical protein